MSAWRHRAYELFPEFGEDVLHRFRASPNNLAERLLAIAVAAHERSDMESLRRIYGYVNWCRNQGDHLASSMDLVFYRRLMRFRSLWELIASWLSPDVVEECWETWKADLSLDEVSHLRSLIEQGNRQYDTVLRLD